MSEIMQLFTNPMGIPGLYDSRWGLPSGAILKCGECEAVLTDQDVKIGQCPACLKVFPSLASLHDEITQADSLDWLAEDVKESLAARQDEESINPYIKNLKEIFEEIRTEGKK